MKAVEMVREALFDWLSPEDFEMIRLVQAGKPRVCKAEELIHTFDAALEQANADGARRQRFGDSCSECGHDYKVAQYCRRCGKPFAGVSSQERLPYWEAVEQARRQERKALVSRLTDDGRLSSAHYFYWADHLAARFGYSGSALENQLRRLAKLVARVEDERKDDGILFHITKVDPVTTRPPAKINVALLSQARKHGQEEMTAEQQCGHPAACIESAEDGTSYCAWCESLDRLEEELTRCENLSLDRLRGITELFEKNMRLKEKMEHISNNVTNALEQIERAISHINDTYYAVKYLTRAEKQLEEIRRKTIPDEEKVLSED